MPEETCFVIEKDFGTLADKGKSYTFHLAQVAWFDNASKYDIRSWNEDMTRCSKGVSLTNDEAYELYLLLKNEFEV